MDANELHEVLSQTPGLIDLLTALNQLQLENKNDLVVVHEALQQFMAEVTSGQTLRPQYLN